MAPWTIRAKLSEVFVGVLGRMPVSALRTRAKRAAELSYWRQQHAIENGLRGDHYERFFTTYFGLTRADYDGKRVLDVGCGPRGSLEWASNAAERVGLDPLASAYRSLGTEGHAMTYISANAESIPFSAEHFDVISAFNSLDHVEDVSASLAEIARVAAPGALLLILTDIGHEPTFTEPQRLDWNVLDRLESAWELRMSRRIARTSPSMMASLDDAIELSSADPGRGFLAALLTRRNNVGPAPSPGRTQT